jgi:hypothetical protein
LGTAIQSTRRTTRASLATGSRGCGDSPSDKSRRASRPSCALKSWTHGAIHLSNCLGPKHCL